MYRFIALLALLTLLGGCSGTPNVDGYQTQSPTLDLFRFFDGKVHAWGIVQNRSGEVIQRFRVDIAGAVDGSSLTLDETFEYQLGDGPLTRTWTIHRNDDGGYDGSASDILGEAQGRSYGNAFNWKYRMDLPVDDASYEVEFDDWFWALSEDSLMNRSTIKKFGIEFASVTIFMQRNP